MCQGYRIHGVYGVSGWSGRTGARTNVVVGAYRADVAISGVIPAESTVETLSIVAETKVSEANCRLFSPQARFFFEIRVS